jgi:hypothetical protein
MGPVSKPGAAAAAGAAPGAPGAAGAPGTPAFICPGAAAAPGVAAAPPGVPGPKAEPPEAAGSADPPTLPVHAPNARLATAHAATPAATSDNGHGRRTRVLRR